MRKQSRKLKKTLKIRLHQILNKKIDFQRQLAYTEIWFKRCADTIKVLWKGG